MRALIAVAALALACPAAASTYTLTFAGGFSGPSTVDVFTNISGELNQFRGAFDLDFYKTTVPWEPNVWRMERPVTSMTMTFSTPTSGTWAFDPWPANAPFNGNPFSGASGTFADLRVIHTPEPATYALMGLGLGLMGLMLRRRPSPSPSS